MSAVLRVEDVHFAYGRVAALDGVSLAVGPGERVALLGRNGAGKSTLVRLVAGLARPARGAVFVGDWDTRARRPEELARRVATVFQHADQQLFARSVRADVEFGPRCLGASAADARARALAALELVGLAAHAEEHPYDLAPPHRKLAALAGALALEPALLVLDEPTAGLDRELAECVARAVARVAERGGAALVVTHDTRFAVEALERVVVLDRGRVAADAPIADFVRDGARVAALGLAPPPAAALAIALQLPGLPVRERDVGRALARVAAPRSPA